MTTIHDIARQRARAARARPQPPRTAADRLVERRAASIRRPLLAALGRQPLDLDAIVGPRSSFRRRPWGLPDWGAWARSAAPHWARAHKVRSPQDAILAAMQAMVAEDKFEVSPECLAAADRIRAPRSALLSTAHGWQEQVLSRGERSIACTPWGAPSRDWQHRRFGLRRHGMDYRYTVAADGDDVTTVTECPAWKDYAVTRPDRLPGLAPRLADAAGRAEVQRRLLERTTAALDADHYRWRPFSDRMVVVWPDGARSVCDLRGQPADGPNYDD